jgi:hypothetical protein
MKNDDAIDRVLTGLRDAKTPAGMERRILAAMEDSAAAPARAGWWLGRPAVAVTCGVAVAAVIAIVVIVPAIHRPGRVAERGSSAVEKQVPSISLSAGSPLPPLPLRQAQGRAGMTASNVAGEKDGSGTFAERLTAPFSSRPEMGENNTVRSAETNAGGDSDIDAVAMSETMAASFPAPPMPLTEQERLLLRMVHRGEPVELAMLDPRIVAMRDWEDKAEFRQVSATPVAKDAAADDSGAAQAGAGTAQSDAETVAESVAGSAAEGVSPAGTVEQPAPERTMPAVANPEHPNVKDGVRQEITTVEKE